MLTLSSIMETLMIILFGLSWPINISKAWKARTAKGTSLLFYFFIWLGYICAIIGKMALIHYRVDIEGSASSWQEVVRWYVLFFYVLNTLMVTAGILIHIRNSRLDKMRGQADS